MRDKQIHAAAIIVKVTNKMEMTASLIKSPAKVQ